MEATDKLYVSEGYIVLEGDRKGVAFTEIVDGKLDPESRLVFSTSKLADKPVGWVVKIKTDGEVYEGFSYVRSIHHDKRMNEFKLSSAVTAKHFELKKLKKKESKIMDMLDGMTLGEIREWAKKSYQNKRALRYYLLELF